MPRAKKRRDVGVKYLLVMWVHMLITKRSIISIILQLIAPTILMCLLIILRHQSPLKDAGPVLTEPYRLIYTDQFPKLIAYSPCNKALQAMFSNFSKNVCYDHEKLLEEASLNASFEAGVVFEDKYKTVQKLDRNVYFKLRFHPSNRTGGRTKWHTNAYFPFSHYPGPRLDKEPDYQQSLFLSLQYMVTRQILLRRFLVPKADLPIVYMQKFPYPPYTKDEFYSPENMRIIILVIFMGFIFLYMNILRMIVHEKELQLKESTRVMGMPGWLQWLGWFTYAFVFILYIVLMMTAMLNVSISHRPILYNSEPSIIFVFLLLYGCSVIAFAFLVSSIFSKTSVAIIIGFFLYYYSIVPFLAQYEMIQSSVTRVFWSLISNTGGAYGLLVILKREAIEKGVKWTNLFSPVSTDEYLTLGEIMIILFLDIFLYIAIALYFEAVFPGGFGYAHDLCFPLRKDYWYGKKSNRIDFYTPFKANEYVEENEDNLQLAIKISNLTKIYNNVKVVNQVNLEIFDGQITALLGHVGAGKTTTLLMITGLVPPTKGTVFLGAFEVKRETQQCRDRMGICLHHNVFYDKLTVAENFTFFSALKGLRKNDLKADVDKYLNILDLKEKQNVYPTKLTLSMRRRMSVGIALCGRTKIVLLDEPTTGMDQPSKKLIWNLLKKEKKGRTIILITHNMDEADLLGDRIVIMYSSEVHCAGSAAFLKKKYGREYYLVLDIRLSCNPNEVTKHIRKYLPGIKPDTYIGTELTYCIPYPAKKDAKNLEQMLIDLEDNFEALKVNSYGISLTTLERVFMKVGSEHLLHLAKYERQLHVSPTQLIIDENATRVTGVALTYNQAKATLYKKFTLTKHEWILLLMQLIISILLIIPPNLNSISDASATHQTFNELEIEMDSYYQPIIFLQSKSTLPFYQSFMKQYGKDKILAVRDVETSVMELFRSDPGFAKTHYIAGVEYEEGDPTANHTNSTAWAWYSSIPYHAAPLSLKLVFDAILYEASDKASIAIANHPLPLTIEQQAKETGFKMVQFQLGASVGWALIFSSGFYIVFLIKERISKCKHLQFVSGLSVLIYWGATFLYDFTIFLINMFCIIISIVVLRLDGFNTFEEITRVFVLLLCFGICIIPFNYVLSLFFRMPVTGFTAVASIGLLCFLALYIELMLEVPSTDMKFVALLIDRIFLITPFYPPMRGIVGLNTHYTRSHICDRFLSDPEVCDFEDVIIGNQINCCDEDAIYGLKGLNSIGRHIIALLTTATIYIILLFVFEYKLFQKLKGQLFHGLPTNVTDIDEDVQEEINKLNETPIDDLKKIYPVVFDHLTKFYGGAIAVNGICLTVKTHECYGLLGVSGSGKTTILDMITGEKSITYGDVYVRGTSVKRQLKGAQQNMGYCPQEENLFDTLTPKEHLKIFALIRGVPTNEVNYEVEKLAIQFDFHRMLNQQVKVLSQGNRRKLSMAIAFVGDPSVIYLDEPTSGMDPATKRVIWQALSKLREAGRTMVISTNSMEECETLCTKIAILDKGNIKCLGSLNRLKKKFSRGTLIKIKLRKHSSATRLQREIKKLETFMKTEFPEAVIRYHLHEMVTYSAPDTILHSKMFGAFERNRIDLNIEDYAISQSSLEKVFIDIAS